MKPISTLLFFILLITANTVFAEGGTKPNAKKEFHLTGTVKNTQLKTIKLEWLGLQKINLLDSSAISNTGEFSMMGAAEPGFCRLKLDERTYFLFFLDTANYVFDLDAQHPEIFTVKGPKSSDEFQRAYKLIGEGQREVNSWNMAYRTLAQQTTSQDTLAAVAQNLQAAQSRLESLLLDSSKTAKSPYVAMFYITNTQPDKFPTETHAILDRMLKEIPNSTYTKELNKLLNKPKPANVSIGQPAPEIDLPTPDGKQLKLSSLRGKVVLIDFWASWCGPCRMEMPNVVAAYNKYKDKGFAIYSVSLDRDATAWKNAIKNLNMTWDTQVSDLKWWQSEPVTVYNVQGIPAAFLIDKNGIIIGTNLRGSALEEKLEEVLK